MTPTDKPSQWIEVLKKRSESLRMQSLEIAKKMAARSGMVKTAVTPPTPPPVILPDNHSAYEMRSRYLFGNKKTGV